MALEKRLYMNRLSRIFILLLCAFSAPNAHADVKMTFYSQQFGDYFPHAFFTLKGNLDGNGQAINSAHGFTAVNTGPGILMGSVKGHVKAPSAKYISKSQPHFTVNLSDEQYRKVMAEVNRWKSIPQKSYNLGKRNCVHFVMEAAAKTGLTVNRKTKFKKKPRSFLNELMSLNPGLKL